MKWLRSSVVSESFSWWLSALWHTMNSGGDTVVGKDPDSSSKKQITWLLGQTWKRSEAASSISCIFSQPPFAFQSTSNFLRPHFGKSCREARKAPLRWQTFHFIIHLFIYEPVCKTLVTEPGSRVPHFPPEFQFNTPAQPSAVYLEV